jgi:hypothetical protein
LFPVACTPKLDSDGSSPAIFSDPSENAGIRLFPVL